MGCTNSAASESQGFGNSDVNSLENSIQSDSAVELMGIEVTWALVELSVKCKKLAGPGMSGNSLCVLSEFNPLDNVWTEISRSEILVKSQYVEKEWIKKFLVHYQFETVQQLKFSVYDCHTDSDGQLSDARDINLSTQNFVGDFITTMTAILVDKNRAIDGTLVPNRVIANPRVSVSPPEIIVKAEEIGNTTDTFSLQLECRGLQGVTSILQIRPFFVIQKKREDGSFVTSYKSEVLVGDSNLFNEISGPLVRLCNGDIYRPLKVAFYNFNGTGRPILIGEVEACFSHLQDMSANGTSLTLLDPKHNLPRGNITVKACSISKKTSFLDYLKQGLQLHFITAIDFTSSNGDPKDPASLHYLNPNPDAMNPYELAISSIARVLDVYDTDKVYPCYGFGAKLTRSGVVNHCFPLNDGPAPKGVDELLKSYRGAVQKTFFAGPTVFSRMISEVKQFANTLPQGTASRNYVILLILTDGAITDMVTCIEEIVAASKSPMSITILGIGKDDFSSMTVLDGDSKKLTARNGDVAVRDIVQFTALKTFSEDLAQIKELNMREVKLTDLICREVLCEIPNQVTSYFEMTLEPHV